MFGSAPQTDGSSRLNTNKEVPNCPTLFSLSLEHLLKSRQTEARRRDVIGGPVNFLRQILFHIHIRRDVLIRLAGGPPANEGASVLSTVIRAPDSANR